MAGRCVHCRQDLRLEPVRCPYCTTLQANLSADEAGQRRRLLGLAAAGLLSGLAWAWWNGPPVVRLPGVPVSVVQARARKAERDWEHLRERYQAARRQFESDGYTLASAAALALDPDAYLGKRLALVGIARETELSPGSARSAISTDWAGGLSFQVDASALPPGELKALLRARSGPHWVVLTGTWERMPAGEQSNAPGRGLRARAMPFVGRSPGFRPRTIEDLTGDP